jgi:hypothetical protein
MGTEDESGDHIDLAALERELARLPDVNAARIVADDGGRPVEVHVLAASDKHPKQIVRDIQSVAMASFGIDLDRRVVSVVRLDREVSATAPGEPRMILRGIVADQQGNRAVLRVRLGRGDTEKVGTAEGSLASTARLRLAAVATLDALRQLVPAAGDADIETATVVRSIERDVAVVNVVFSMQTHEEVLSGSAIVRDAGDVDAIVRAVLDATNRRLPALHPAGH